MFPVRLGIGVALPAGVQSRGLLPFSDLAEGMAAIRGDEVRVGVKVRSVPH